jgi:hypothetical protein
MVVPDTSGIVEVSFDNITMSSSGYNDSYNYSSGIDYTNDSLMNKSYLNVRELVPVVSRICNTKKGALFIAVR